MIVANPEIRVPYIRPEDRAERDRLERRQLLLLEQNVKLMRSILEQIDDPRKIWVPDVTSVQRPEMIKRGLDRARDVYLKDLSGLVVEDKISVEVRERLVQLFAFDGKQFTHGKVDLEKLNDGLREIEALVSKGQ